MMPIPFPRAALGLALLLLTASSELRSDSLFGKRCDKNAALEPFLAGYNFYRNENPFLKNQCKQAIPPLQTAANLCPDPEVPWEPSNKLFGSAPYLPFYYLGNCHFRLKNQPNALRNFYVSQCVNEPERDPNNTTKDLDRHLKECRDGFERRRLPGKHPTVFGEGIAVARLAEGSGDHSKDWEETANKMWEALQIQEEDGENFSPEGARFQAPYLPRFRLGVALYHLGCYREALAQLSLVNPRLLQTGWTKKERNLMNNLKPKVQEMAQGKYEDPEICRFWKCWLGEGRPE